MSSRQREIPAEQIAFAAEWWANHLREPVRHDNGDTFSSAMMGLLSQKLPRVTDEQIDAFKTALEKLLSESGERVIGVDYHPDPILAEAAKAAGIEGEYRFPVKTVMWINPGAIKVSVGYRGVIRTIIYETKDTDGG